MKNIALTAAGLAALLLAAVCPLPPMLAVPGAAWRILLGLLGFSAATSGMYRAARKK